MPDTMTQKYYKDIFLKNLEKISSKEKQERAWVYGNYEGFNTFVEIFEGFISPCESVKNWSALSNQQRKNLQKYYDLLINYDDTKKIKETIFKKSDKEICQDPLWKEIRDFGKWLYEDLKKVSL
ncbi:MAG: hypothetical protein KDK76_01435 [Chlamydiia bacterium]|nr:hypothetical protein [Chlamydiia bacterium]